MIKIRCFYNPLLKKYFRTTDYENNGFPNFSKLEMNEKTQDMITPVLTIYSEATKHLFSKSDQSLFETLPYKMPTNTKYLESQKRMIIKGTKKIFKNRPETPLKQVIIEKLKPMPDFLTAENLLKVVGYITKTWEACQVKAVEETPLAVD